MGFRGLHVASLGGRLLAAWRAEPNGRPRWTQIPNWGSSFGNVIELSDSGHETPTKNIIGANDATHAFSKGREFIELSGSDNLVPTCSAVVRTELQKRLGGYRNELPHTGDMEMWLRFAAHAPVGFISAYQGVYRQHGANMSTAYYSIFKWHVLYAKERSFSRCSTTEICPRLLRQTLPPI